MVIGGNHVRLEVVSLVLDRAMAMEVMIVVDLMCRAPRLYSRNN